MIKTQHDAKVKERKDWLRDSSPQKYPRSWHCWISNNLRRRRFRQVVFTAILPAIRVPCADPKETFSTRSLSREMFGGFMSPGSPLSPVSFSVPVSPSSVPFLGSLPTWLLVDVPPEDKPLTILPVGVPLLQYSTHKSSTSNAGPISKITRQNQNATTSDWRCLPSPSVTTLPRVFSMQWFFWSSSSKTTSTLRLRSTWLA